MRQTVIGEPPNLTGDQGDDTLKARIGDQAPQRGSGQRQQQALSKPPSPRYLHNVLQAESWHIAALTKLRDHQLLWIRALGYLDEIIWSNPLGERSLHLLGSELSIHICSH